MAAGQHQPTDRQLEAGQGLGELARVGRSEQCIDNGDAVGVDDGAGIRGLGLLFAPEPRVHTRGQFEESTGHATTLSSLPWH